MVHDIVNPALIDGVAIDPETGEASLLVIEGRPWADKIDDQIEEIATRINAYLAFIRDEDEFAAVLPEAVGRKLRIEVVSLEEPTDRVEAFFEQARRLLDHHGIGFAHRTGDPGPAGTRH